MNATERDSAETIGRAGLVLAITGALLVFTIKVPDAYGIPKLIATGLGVLTAWAGVLLGIQSRRLNFRRADGAALACGAATLVCAAFSEDPLRSLSGGYVYFLGGVLPVSLYLSLYFAAGRFDSHETILRVLRLGLAAAVLCGVYAGLQALGVEPVLPAAGHGTISGRVISTLGGPVYLGSALIPFAPTALYFSLRQNRADRVLGIVATGAVWAGLLFSGSRGAMIGATVGSLFAWIASQRALSRVFLSGKNIAAGAAALTAVAVLASLIGTARTQADRSRVEVWKTAVRIAAEHPVFGVGPDAFEIGFRKHRTEAHVRMLGPVAGQADAHNDFLHVAATTGGLGLLAYGFLLWTLCAGLAGALSRDGPERALFAALGGALLGVFLQAKVNPVSFSALVSLSVFSGWIVSRVEPSKFSLDARAVGAAFAAVAVAGLALSADLFYTDRLRQVAETARAKGDMDATIIAYRSAIRKNPFYAEYGSSYATVLAMLVRKAPEVVRAPLAKELFTLSGIVKRRHPGDVRGPHLSGLACAVGGTLAGEDCLSAALSAIARARELDPYSTTVLADSAALARMAQDEAAAVGFERRRTEILALRGAR